MRFSDAFLDEIRERVPISDVVGRRVTFDRKKSNPSRGDHWGCCPFHGEKTPSFHCEDRKGRYYCFGCQASGDHFRFLVELDGMSFPEAVEQLAGEAGLEMPKADPQARERERQRASLHDVMAMAAVWFREQLAQADGANARSYLRGRGLDARVQEAFGIGYAPPGRSRLKEFLGGKGVEPSMIEACGLVVHGEGIAVSYDRFRDRIMFPITDVRDRVIAFGGRALSPDVPAKYLNSPETDLFHKGRILYNHARARRALGDKSKPERSVIAVEGYMDAIALHVAGFPQAVAPLGTALTEDHLAHLWRMSDEPILSFDGDEAGLRAAYRAVDLALERLVPGKSVRFALLPEGQDPDDVLKSAGPDALRGVLDAARPLADMVWRRETSGTFDTPERRAELERTLHAIARTIRDESVQRHYVQDFRERLAGFFGSTPQRKRQDRSGRHERSGRQGRGTGWSGDRNVSVGRLPVSDALAASLRSTDAVSPPGLRECVLLGTVLYHPAVGVERFDTLSALHVAHPNLRALQSAMVGLLTSFEGESPTPEWVLEQLTEAGQGQAVGLVGDRLRTARVWQALPGAAFEDARDGWLQAVRLHERSRALAEERRRAQAAFDDDASDENYERLIRITREIASDSGTEALIDSFGEASGRPMKAL